MLYENTFNVELKSPCIASPFIDEGLWPTSNNLQEDLILGQQIQVYLYGIENGECTFAFSHFESSNPEQISISE